MPLPDRQLAYAAGSSQKRAQPLVGSFDPTLGAAVDPKSVESVLANMPPVARLYPQLVARYLEAAGVAPGVPQRRPAE